MQAACCCTCSFPAPLCAKTATADGAAVLTLLYTHHHAYSLSFQDYRSSCRRTWLHTHDHNRAGKLSRAEIRKPLKLGHDRHKGAQALGALPRIYKCSCDPTPQVPPFTLHANIQSASYPNLPLIRCLPPLSRNHSPVLRQHERSLATSALTTGAAGAPTLLNKLEAHMGAVQHTAQPSSLLVNSAGSAQASRGNGASSVHHIHGWLQVGLASCGRLIIVAG